MSQHLYLLRHGNSPMGEGLPDKERILSDLGRQNVSEMGGRLTVKGIKPDMILCSTAQRTKMTAQLLMEAMGLSADSICYDDRIYNASLEALVYLARETEEDISTLLVIGHNPGLSELVHFGDGESYCKEQGFYGLTTASFAYLELSVPWSQFDAGTARVVEILSPR